MKIDTNKILLASGCSYTEPNRNMYMDKPIPAVTLWCDRLSQQYDMKLVNLAMGGTGNSFIAQRINEYIVENHKKIGLVCVLWSGWERISFYNHNGFNVLPLVYNHIISKNTGKAALVYYKKHISLKYMDLIDQFPVKSNTNIEEDMVKHNIMAFNSVETLCKLHNIPYIFMQGTSHHLDCYKHLDKFSEDYSEILEAILANEHLIDESKFIGWPPDKRLGGFDYRILRKKYTTNENEWHLVPEFDNHPNDIGHEYIAKYFYNGIKERYEN